MPLQTRDLQLQEQMLPCPFNWYLQSLSKLADLSLPRNPCSSRANSKSLCVERTFEECAFCQAERKRYTLKEWEGKLASATVRKEDMNELVMNFLVTEVGPVPFTGNWAVHQEQVPYGGYLAFDHLPSDILLPFLESGPPGKRWHNIHEYDLTIKHDWRRFWCTKMCALYVRKFLIYFTSCMFRCLEAGRLKT